MSTISTANLSSATALFARSKNSATANVFTAKPQGDAGNGASPSSTVSLSDHAKALMLRAQQESSLADRLAAHLQGGGAGGGTGGGTGAGGAAALLDSGNAGITNPTVATVRQWAKLDAFQNAAGGAVDDQLRAAVRDGQLPTLAKLQDGEWDQLSPEEQNVYGAVSTLQDLYGAMPKTMDQALADYKKVVLESYPDDIARMRSGLASGSLKAEDGWKDIIASREAELAAAQQGTMTIHAVNDPSLIQTTNQFTVSRDSNGWSGNGIKVDGNFEALASKFGAKNISIGSSPYTGDYAITW